jgi:SAM-dependent methyltransferase
LSRDEARRFYDRFGARQDAQAWYEDAPVEDLVAHSRFAAAGLVVELGCGTGRLAERLLDSQMPVGARYIGLDLSSRMRELTSARLARFGERAQVWPCEGPRELDLPTGSVDRFVATYVLEILAPEDARNWLAEAHRLLAPGGLVGLTALTRGRRPASRLVSGLWSLVHRLRPAAVGGCRPVELGDFVDAALWRVEYREVHAPWAVPSEVMVATPAAR